MIHFFLIVNRQCQTRFSKYYTEKQDTKEHSLFELDVARNCITRKPNQCLFFSLNEYKIVYRTYASLVFIIGCDPEENEFSMLELIQVCVESLDKYFEKVTELDIVFNLEKVHMIMDEIVVKGMILEVNQERILGPIYALANQNVKSVS